MALLAISRTCAFQEWTVKFGLEFKLGCLASLGEFIVDCLIILVCGVCGVSYICCLLFAAELLFFSDHRLWIGNHLRGLDVARQQCVWVWTLRSHDWIIHVVWSNQQLLLKWRIHAGLGNTLLLHVWISDSCFLLHYWASKYIRLDGSLQVRILFISRNPALRNHGVDLEFLIGTDEF